MSIKVVILKSDHSTQFIMELNDIASKICNVEDCYPCYQFEMKFQLQNLISFIVRDVTQNQGRSKLGPLKIKTAHKKVRSNLGQQYKSFKLISILKARVASYQ